MSYDQTWTSRLAQARAAGRTQEAALTAVMIRAAPPEALGAAMASHDAPALLAAALDTPRLRPLTLWLRLRTAQARLLHRWYEDAIAANNAAAARGDDEAIMSNAELAVKLLAARDTLAAAGLPESARNMGNWELLAWLWVLGAQLTALIVVLARAGWWAQ